MFKLIFHGPKWLSQVMCPMYFWAYLRVDRFTEESINASCGWTQRDFWVVVSNIFYFHPYLGKIPILTNIFQRGWNHQPGFVLKSNSEFLNIIAYTPT